MELDIVSEQKDLEVLISNDLLARKHILETKKANQRVVLIRCCFTNITQHKISTLFKTSEATTEVRLSSLATPS